MRKLSKQTIVLSMLTALTALLFSFSFAQAQHRDEHGSNFGATLHGYGTIDSRTNETTLKAFSEIFDKAGMEIARFEVSWGKISTEKGVYDWTLVDKQLSTVDRNTPVLFTISSTSKWGSRYNSCRAIAAEYFGISVEEIYNRPPSSIPLNMEDYMEFLNVLVNRYKDRVKYWQIENEVHSAVEYEGMPTVCPRLLGRYWIGTMDEYVQLLSSSYTKIKEVDPDAKVLASGFMKSESYQTEVFTDYILENGEDSFDILDIHLYKCPETDINRIEEIREKIDALDYDKPFWATESGEIDIVCHDDDPDPDACKFTENINFDCPEELKLQSEEIIKRHVLAFSNGIEKLFRLRLNPYNDNEDPSNRFTHMGLTFDPDPDPDGNDKKPGFYTYRIMTSMLRNFDSVEKINAYVYRFNFTDNDRSVYVLWNDSEDSLPVTVDLSPYIQRSTVTVTHIVTELDPVTNEPIFLPDETVPTNAVPISETPVFVEGRRGMEH